MSHRVFRDVFCSLGRVDAFFRIPPPITPSWQSPLFQQHLLSSNQTLTFLFETQLIPVASVFVHFFKHSKHNTVQYQPCYLFWCLLTGSHVTILIRYNCWEYPICNHVRCVPQVVFIPDWREGEGEGERRRGKRRRRGREGRREDEEEESEDGEGRSEEGERCDHVTSNLSFTSHFSSFELRSSCLDHS